jgi:hypothetical protein
MKSGSKINNLLEPYKLFSLNISEARDAYIAKRHPH